mmetsp:Transcript_8258/g.24424  ORF Transcript_8258/g.24424 Transcript_8258/m.24424 type:complete len:450 (-) Transcript_8258:754-2103(-)
MNIGNNNGGGGFRGFASKLRGQAKDVVQVAGNLNNYKLPSFDDMAQNDQYIHSPDFNVRGSMSSENTTGGTASATETTAMAANNNNVETATADDVASYYSHSTGSSWSLLDRTASSLLDRSNIDNNNNNNDNKSDANEIVSTTVQPTKQSESESDPAKITRHQPTARTSSVSLLSVVTDTLQQQQQQQPTRPGIGAGSTNYDTSSMNTMSNSNDNGSVDDSSEDFDEEDPILSMIRNKDKQVAGGSNGSGSGNSDGNGNDAPTSVITIRNPKPSNRFMEDVRLQTPLHQPQQTIDEMLANGALQEKSGMQPEDPNTGENRSSGPFGGYFKNMALDSLNRFKLGLNSKQQQQQLRTPPLSRGRKKIQQTLPRDEESDYEITTSAGMLGEDDLEHLKQLQLGSASAGPSKLAMMLRAEFWNEHKHFLFVAFTLGLAIYVYFFADTVEDDVT